MGLEAIAALGGLIIPPVFDFIKKKFIGTDKDTPEATMSTLATSKPEVLPDYLNATVNYMRSKIEFFNRDVIGTPSSWVVNLRAVIRPLVTIFAIMLLASDGAHWLELNEATRASLCLIVSSWFGDRIAFR